MSLLPLAARCRRIEPGAKSLDRSCHLEWCEEHCAMVHHAKWSGPRSAVQAECKRWDHYAFRVEGTEQIPSHVRGRSIQRRDGHHEPTVSAGARRNAWLPL